jgi:hypothetical protein
MTLDDIWGQLESDLKWRQEEVRLLGNNLGSLRIERDRELARRSLLVMLYAHTEGFTKVALSTYVRAINDRGLKGREAIEGIVASAFVNVFHGIQYGDKKGKVFKRKLPDDEGLAAFSRQCEFIAEVDGLLSSAVTVPDEAVDTETNLNSKVLRRNLYKLGLPVEKFESYEDDLNELVYRRHSIAHGVDDNPIKKDLYDKLQRSAFNFMDELILEIIAAIESTSFMRKTPSAA